MILRCHILTPTARGWSDWPDGRLEIAQGRIRSAGPWRPGGKATDLRPQILFPGLVDTHAHVPQLPMCGIHSDSLLGWLHRWVYPLEMKFRGARAKLLTRAFLREMIANGTTTAALYTSAWPDSVEECFDAAKEAGIHAWIGPPLMDVDPYRKITTKQVLSEAQDLASLDRPRLRFAVTPRFALSCTKELLEGAGELARSENLPIQTHLSEQREETRAVQRRFGRGYVETYRRAGLVTNRTIFAHCVHMKDRDWRGIGGCAVAHCPTSNVFLGSGVMDWKRARQLRLGLGTDVGAGPDLSILRVARSAWTVHSLTGRAPSASELLRSATLGGAQALGFPDVGSLEPGRSADLLVLNTERILPPGAPEVESTEDLLSRILHRAGRSSILRVFVAGRDSRRLLE